MFVIAGLDPQIFAPLRAAGPAALAAHGARRVIADGPGYPCRVSLIDAPAGEALILCHHVHHAVAGPYRASGPIYVRVAAARAARFVDEIPPVLATRLLSVRAYDAAGELRGGEVVDGAELRAAIARGFADPEVAYLHAHNARPGCFAARIDRG